MMLRSRAASIIVAMMAGVRGMVDIVEETIDPEVDWGQKEWAEADHFYRWLLAYPQDKTPAFTKAKEEVTRNLGVVMAKIVMLPPSEAEVKEVAEGWVDGNGTRGGGL